MRKIIYALQMSLDGFIEGENGDLSWSNPDEELFTHFLELDAAMDLFLYGRGLYQTMAAFWPTADEDPSATELEKRYARQWRAMPKVVVSTTLELVDWNSKLIRGNLAEEIGRLKQQPGSAMNVGGAGLAASLLRLGLIDEIRTYVHPVILGEGKPMFPHLTVPINLELLETRVFRSKVVMMQFNLKKTRTAGM